MRKLAFFAGFAAIFLIANQASADDGKVYPGSFCKATYYKAQTNDEIRYSTPGGAYSRATNVSSTNLTCPIVRDNRSDWPPEGIAVHFEDQNPNYNMNVCCKATIRDSTGTTFHTTPTKCSSGTGFGQYWLNFGTINYSYGLHAAYKLDCSLPPETSEGEQSQIVSYVVNEKSGDF